MLKFYIGNKSTLVQVMAWCQQPLTHKQLKTYECIIITVVTDDLVLKHQAILTYITEWNTLYCVNLMQNFYIYGEQNYRLTN